MPTAVSLSQMVDLALGTPEVGAVNFNVLHTLLHSMLGKLEIKDHKGVLDEADKEFLTTTIVGPAGPEKNDVLPENTGKDGTSSLTEKKAPYHKLLDRMNKLESQMENLNALPSNADLFGRAKSQESTAATSAAPLQDMWQLLQVQKRVDANEIGINKLMSLVEDLMREMQSLKDANSALEKKMGELNLDELNGKIKQMEDQMDAVNDMLSQYPLPEEVVTWEGLEKSLNGIREDLSRPQERVVIEFSTQTDKPEMVSRPVSARPISALSLASSSGPSTSLADVLEKLGSINERHEDLENRVKKLEGAMPNKAEKSDLEGLGTGLPEGLIKQIEELKDEMERLKKSRAADSDALARIQQAIIKLQDEVEKLNDQTQHLLTENESKHKQIQSLCNITTTLEDKKADKDYVNAEVDVKADKKEVHGKVNRSLFDSTCNELNKMISDLLEKLAAYEEAWKNAHGQLSSDIDGKLDRLELDALKDYIDAKLKALNSKLKGAHDWIPTQQGDDDAAGIRKQLLQRFNCISCDRPVEMMPSAIPLQAMPSGTGLPGTRSPRPYTTFELDQIRQHAKSLLNPDGIDYYSTQRACGGTHTTTFPHRRTTRLTNLREVFIDDTGYVAPPKENERDIQGADGHIYKGRLDRTLPNLQQQQPQQPPQTRPQTVAQSRGSRVVRPPASPVNPRPASARNGSRTGSGRLINRPQSARTPSPPSPPLESEVVPPLVEVPTNSSNPTVIEVHTPVPPTESMSEQDTMRPLTPVNTEIQIGQ